MSGLIAKKELKTVVQPQSWFKGSKLHGERGAEKHAETDALVIKPTDHEQDMVLAGKPCQACRFFKHREGQERLVGDRVTQMLMFDLKWTSFVESTDPVEYGNCDADNSKLTHRMASCKLWQPKDENSSNIWRRVKAAYSAFWNPGEQG
jgi:hypothetical protein